ncbi:hypothetical protein GCM10009681_21450 [Luedemannella helvata]|uniref:Secreted protein n=1 Tax=Luedemannella helvata TaxID=349315 RepID=A0ABP4WCG5_9ACTN
MLLAGSVAAAFAKVVPLVRWGAAGVAKVVLLVRWGAAGVANVVPLARAVPGGCSPVAGDCRGRATFRCAGAERLGLIAKGADHSKRCIQRIA